MKETITKLINGAIEAQGMEAGSFVVEHPAELLHGDYSSNVALMLAKNAKKDPIEVAVDLTEHIKKNLPKEIVKVEVARPGFINFYLSDDFFSESIKQIVENEKGFGKNDSFSGKKVAIEYTDPNPFKQFHIGHLMTNIIGESLARLYEWNGAEVKRFCYQGDVGRHVALCIWGFRFMDRPFPKDDAPLSEKTQYLGESYVLASQKIKAEPENEAEVQKINKLVYDRSDKEINDVYEKGRTWSLEHFEEIYKILGTKFDHYFFESETAPIGKEIVEKNTPAVFKESEGAIVFKGEDYDLHTRVFITKEGVPTYEAKELGLAELKYKTYPSDTSFTITAHEQNDYFKVVLKALSLISPDVASTMSHISHGMLRLSSGKMSSRTGNVITGESLLNDMIKLSTEKVEERELSAKEKGEISQQVGVGAIKYSILKQSIGKDIIFDEEKSLSFEGDSGPYLQYAHTRARSVLRKAEEEKIKPNFTYIESEISKTLYRFPEIVEESLVLKAPQQLVTYLTELASLFNSFYTSTTVIDHKDPLSGSKVSLVHAFATVMENGLQILGIPVPEKM